MKRMRIRKFPLDNCDGNNETFHEQMKRFKQSTAGFAKDFLVKILFLMSYHSNLGELEMRDGELIFINIILNIDVAFLLNCTKPHPKYW